MTDVNEGPADCSLWGEMDDRKGEANRSLSHFLSQIFHLNRKRKKEEKKKVMRTKIEMYRLK